MPRRGEAVPLHLVVLLVMDDDGLRAARGHNGKPAPFPVDELVPDMDKAQLACPLCGKTNTLYENVTVQGWRSVTGHDVVQMDETCVVPRVARGPGALDADVEWDSAEHQSYACSECCQDGYFLSEIALAVPPKMGWDGAPVRAPLKGQITITEG